LDIAMMFGAVVTTGLTLVVILLRDDEFFRSKKSTRWGVGPAYSEYNSTSKLDEGNCI
jgi:hypothetical protein